MGRFGHFFAMLALLCAPGPGGADPGAGFPALRDSFDAGLQAGLERVVDDLGLAHAVAGGHLALALVDITDPTGPRLATLNGDRMYYAASLPKIAILLGAFVEIERGRMRLDAPTRASLSRMVRISSNSDATRILNRVGRQRLIEILRDGRFRLYDPAANGGLWVGKEYGKSPAYRRDPLHNLSHAATAIQTARFYYLLETNRLVDPRLGRTMKSMLGDSGISHKFVKGLSGVSEVKIYRKSGTWRRWHSDSALVEAGAYKYIIVGLANDARGGEWLTRIARPVHRLIALRHPVSR